MEVLRPFATLSYVIESGANTVDIPEPFRPLGTGRPHPNDPPWGVAAAFGVWFLSVCFIAVIPALFLAPYAISQRSAYADGSELMQALATDPIAIGIQVAGVIPAHLLTIVLAWMVVTKGRLYSFKEMLGWRSGGMQWWHYAAIMLAIFGLALVVGTLIPEQENELTRILKSSRFIVFLVAAMATLTAPLVEEVVYRGVVYSALQRWAGVSTAVGLVTLLFAIVHLPQYYPSVSTMVLLTILSLILTLVRVKTGNVLPCIILHTIFNGLQSVLLIVEPYIRVNTTADQVVSTLLPF